MVAVQLLPCGNLRVQDRLASTGPNLRLVHRRESSRTLVVGLPPLTRDRLALPIATPELHQLEPPFPVMAARYAAALNQGSRAAQSATLLRRHPRQQDYVQANH